MTDDRPFVYACPVIDKSGEEIPVKLIEDKDGGRSYINKNTGKPVKVREWAILGDVVYGADAEIATWVNAQMGGGLVELLFIGLGILKPGTNYEDVSIDTLPNLLAGGAYYFNEIIGEDFSDIQVAVAATDDMMGAPGVVRRMLDYPFGQRGHRRITLFIHSDNERAIRQAKKIGCKLEGKQREAGPGGSDILMFGLLARECPFWTRDEQEAA